MTARERLDVYIRRYLGDVIADRLPDMPADEIPSLLARAELSRAYFQEDLRSPFKKR